MFAWSLASSDRAHQWLYAARTKRLLSDLEGAADLTVGSADLTVLEVGAGAGPNAAHLPPGTRWIAVEPNVHFHPRLEAAAARQGLDLEAVAATAEALPLEDGAADVVISTLVLCSVDDVARSLAEVRRVLRPGGRFVFIEHVVGPPGSM
ncbi:class I SAM-dependent methyltransferase, partial [Rubrivirga sp.]|uniref:class I SAM-dependent methyltransferase n=1 Tax=Rubrivirga sp. TaxID=1885344 RepID=UPI003C7613E5